MTSLAALAPFGLTESRSSLEGLKKGKRHHVHLSKDTETAKKVGARRGKPVVLQVDAASMHRQGFKFFVSANGVWLADSVPAAFLAR